jgi:hypothetical protein
MKTGNCKRIESSLLTDTNRLLYSFKMSGVLPPSFDYFCDYHYDKGHAMGEVVSRRSLNAEARVRARVSLCGICGGQRQWNRFFSEFLGFPLSKTFHCGSPYSRARCWPPFIDTVSSHRHGQQQQESTDSHCLWNLF